MKMSRVAVVPVAVSSILFMAACGGSGSSSGGSGGGASSSAAPPPSSAVQSTALESKLGPVPQSDGMKVSYVAKTLINEYWQDVKSGAEGEAKQMGIGISVQASKDESSLTDQLDLGRTVLSKKPDALLLSPQSDSNMQSVIQDAKRQGIPTIVLNDARTEGTDVYVGPDQEKVGQDAAAYVLKSLPGGGDVAQIEGQAGSPNARLRIQGFKKGVAGSGGKLKLVASQPADWDRLKALEAATNILRANPNVKAFYANNDTMALGVVEAVKKSGKKGIVIVGTDGIRQARSSIKNGGLTATIAESPCTEGKLGVQIAARLKAKQKVPAWVLSPTKTIDTKNVDQVGTTSCL
jgi:ribose transport system substrate-binding protein